MPNVCINPATEEPLPCPPDHTDAEMESMLRRAREALVVWRDTAMGERARLMRQAGAVLRRDREVLARLMTTEMGKPITAAGQEVDKCATACGWFADNAAKLLEPREIPSDASRSFVRFDPIGPVLAIMPWNFPLWQVFRFAAPTLMAGNTGLLKHAPNVPGCSAAIENVFTDAGFPAGVFQSLRLSNDQAARAIANDAVAAVTLTGSTRAGRSVAATAGKALKKTVLELGGSDPFIVIPKESDFLWEAAEHAVKARCINTGQSCIAAKRFIVVGWTDPFEQHFAKMMGQLKIGDPMDPATEIGPLARLDLLENLHDQVERSVAAGAYLVCGGRRLDRKGYFYAPTILSDVTPGMPAFDEETFGPVAAVVAAKDVDHAIELANQSPYGLGASIWTRDVALAEKIAPRIESGNVFINGMVKSDPRLPFGGVKQSGYGRELSPFGIHEFVNIKTVWIK
jgi:succinate-semialdehyde dehydrogenase/glutarate-semialdehyde dehydrogenase